ncbi:histidine phosphatase family protein [Sphingobium sp. CCH11-B1]|jgi:probable phosphoglycerate mutase|uniref:histidine phosphatase family protein n=1 Tax=Sphingobium sp. CCH11-B1 TaxID=1768781 RepID=UPI000829894C|nr:histidine phosphatase family protein [Sphingobium sp. CCH11-B1]MEA3388853.1 histidine phosphatase family protein [Pseudomonadota bacterium]
MRRLFIIRHGNTFASSAEARRVGARTDIPLVESGRMQAEQLGQWFAREKLAVRRILSSPLQRARQTAELIAAAVGVECAGSCDWLGEIDHGPDEDQPEAAVLARIGADALARWDEQAIPPDGWIVDAEARVQAWRAFFAEGGEGVDLLVTSNGAARFALVASGLSRGALKLRTGAFGELAVDDDGRVSLIRWDVRP